MRTECFVEKEIEKFLPFFLSSREKELKVIEQHFELNDFTSISRICHNLKGIAKPYGFPTLGEIAKALECACEKPNKIEIQKLISQMKEYISFHQNN